MSTPRIILRYLLLMVSLIVIVKTFKQRLFSTIPLINSKDVVYSKTFSHLSRRDFPHCFATLTSLTYSRNEISIKVDEHQSRRYKRRRDMKLKMVFDFFKNRAEEGLAQMQNIASKTIEGKFSEAIKDSMFYVQQRQKIDSENLMKLTFGLTKSRDRLLGGIASVFEVSESTELESRLLKIEEVLLQADIGSTTTNTIIDDLRTFARAEGLKADDILPVLRLRLVEALTPTASSSLNIVPNNTEPTVIFVIGANGMGKSTTIGKIASRLKNEQNMTVLLGACDTFRAAAVEQLGTWAVRANVTMIEPYETERGGDPVPVVTRTVRSAIDGGYDVCIIDTSGRLSNNFELIEQLKNMKKAIQLELPSGPHETLLVIDGSVGRNAIDQAIAWKKYVGVTGLVVTKLDGTARGGFVVSAVRDLQIPIKYIGVGEKIDDLRDFSAEVFVDALLGNNEQAAEELKARAGKMMNLINPSPSSKAIVPVNALSSPVPSSASPSLDRLRESFAAAKAARSEKAIPSNKKNKKKSKK